MWQNKHWVILGLVCSAIFLSNLDVIYVNIMEARNFITAREMIHYDNWLHTTMNLEPRYEKPPLPTWLTAISASIFGLDSLFGLRLPAALSVIFLIFVFYKLTALITQSKAQSLTASLILATSFYIIFSGRNGQWDIFAHAFMMYAIYQFYQIFGLQRSGWKPWLLTGVFLAASFMSKGPVSFFALLLPFLIAYGVVFKFQKKAFSWTKTTSMLLVFALLGLSWGIFIFLTDGASAEAISDKETAAWSNRNVRPFYYYWSFFTQSGLWTFFAFIGLLYPFMKKRVSHLKAYRFSIWWTLSAVVLLSLIPEKKSRYLLPVLIPLALNTSFYIQYLINQAKSISKPDRYIANFGFGLIGIIGLLFPLIGYVMFKEQLAHFSITFGVTSLVLFCIGVYILKTLAKKQYQQSFFALIGFMCSIMVFGFPLAKMFYSNEAFNNIKNVRNHSESAAVKLFIFGEIAPELIWELGEPAKRVEAIDKLPTDQTIGLFSNEKLNTDAYKNWEITPVEQFDINYIDQSKSGYKKRLTAQYYLVKKK